MFLQNYLPLSDKTGNKLKDSNLFSRNQKMALRKPTLIQFEWLAILNTEVRLFPNS